MQALFTLAMQQFFALRPWNTSNNDRENFPTVLRNHTDVMNHPLLPCFQANRLDLEDGPHYEIIKQTTFKVHDKLIKSRKNTRNN